MNASDKKNVLQTVKLGAATVLVGSATLLAPGSAAASGPFTISALGSGAGIRSAVALSFAHTPLNYQSALGGVYDKGAEGKCGEGKCGDDKEDTKDDKSAEGKCGEGKCGDKK